MREFFNKNSISFNSTDDINEDLKSSDIITKKSLGIGIGEAWGFSRDIIDRFNGHLIDLMGIRLPQYRGGAHYTWQILRKNRIGCCNLQLINEDMVQGVFDSGEIVKTEEYFFPPSARTPEDYFEYAVRKEINFIKEFLDELKDEKSFELGKLQENFSIFFPRLYTLKHAMINWSWDTNDIESFICAFDDPYAGAATFLNGKKVHLKNCYVEFNDGPFHPFQAGLIYKIYNESVFIATKSGTLIVNKILDENGQEMTSKLNTGQRLFTPLSYLEEAMTASVEYSSQGKTK